MTAAARTDRRPIQRHAEAAITEADSVDQYLREVGRYSLLTNEEEYALGLRARDGDDDAVVELVSRNLRFVISVAKKFQNRGLPLSDLIGEGNVGLLTAARKFDPEQGVRFISYAVWWIRQAILSAVARAARIVRVPTNRAAELTKVNRAADGLRQKLLREPSLREISEASGVPLDVVRAAGGHGMRDVSLDSPVNSEGEQTLLDRYGMEEDSDSEDDTTTSLLRDRLAEALDLLPQRSARILRLHFGLEGGREHTLEEIGAVLGVTRERVRQLRDRAFRRLREGELARSLGDFAGVRGVDTKFAGDSDASRHRIQVRRRRVTAASRNRVPTALFTASQ